MCGRIFAATDACTALSATRGIAACAAKFKYVASSIGNHSFFQSIDCFNVIIQLSVLGVKRAISGVRLKNDWTLVPYGRYSLGSGAVADSACTMMPVTRQPPASLIASMLLMPRATCLPSLYSA